ncbi:DUF5666 domain-containing protein [Nocardia huaxiensis]|uniref:DUF5666 domain-containing protein n=1 Tax=Nocardia huaxiensis TaxID=2755382 RepID=UPI001E31E7BB|nr:DUF5666 domain-containing protein [Nocardia huaxiensis]UFS94291.1 DUF5666 domain-containing protein [Nocardia huaxiensis]
MTNPSDPWSRRPEPEPADGPTEKAGPAEGQTGYTSDAGEAYGQTQSINYGEAALNPPGDHSPTEYFGQPPGPDATRVMPPPDTHWGGYENGGGYTPPPGEQQGGYQPTAAYGTPPGYQPTATFESGPGYPPTASYPNDPGAGAYGAGPAGAYGASGYSGQPGYPGGPGGPGGYPPAGQPGPQPPRKNTTKWVVLGLAVIALVAVAGVLIGALLADKDSSDTASATTTARTTFVMPNLPGNSSQPLPSGIPEIPGLGEIDSLGATLGTVAANDGKTLTLTSLSGTSVTVKTDDSTQVISLGSTKVADLPVGEMVMVQGDKAADGSIQAKIIISTSLPGGTR